MKKKTWQTCLKVVSDGCSRFQYAVSETSRIPGSSRLSQKPVGCGCSRLWYGTAVFQISIVAIQDSHTRLHNMGKSVRVSKTEMCWTRDPLKIWKCDYRDLLYIHTHTYMMCYFINNTLY